MIIINEIRYKQLWIKLKFLNNIYMKWKIAIVTNGGGMNCSYSAWALCSLARNYDLKEPELLIGSSGSTGSLTYYLTQQYDEIKNIWTNLLTSKNFIRFQRLKRIMDIDYLIDEIFKIQEPLNINKINNSKTKLFISSTEYKNGKVKFFSNISKYDIFESLRASKAIPILYNKKVNIKNIDYIDGSLSATVIISIEKAIKEGGKNIIVICDWKKISTLTKIFLSIYSIFINKSLHSSIKKYINQDISHLEKKEFEDINIIFIYPSRKLKTNTLNNKKENLEDSFNLGFEDIKKNNKLKLFLDSIEEKKYKFR